MTLAAVLILPISLAIIGTVMKHSQKYFRAQQKYLGDVNGQVEEIYSGHNVVKAFNKEDYVVDVFEKTNDKLYESAWKSQFFSGMMMPGHAVYRQSGVRYGGFVGWFPHHQRQYRCGRCSGIFPVYPELYTAYSADRTGNKYAPVHGGCSRTCI